jgi:predicted 3-demethylubiquinone-9 3-methyltransferase (glyoxalase superfamily)
MVRSSGARGSNFYVSIFKNSRIVHLMRCGETGHEVHGRPAGSVLTVEFALNGQAFIVRSWDCGRLRDETSWQKG